MKYKEIKIAAPSDFTEILMAELSMLGYDSFAENDKGFDAYVEEGMFEEKTLQDITEKYHQLNLSYSVGDLEERNWNKEWESYYDPVRVADQVYIRAHFHEADPAVPYEIVITPKMSFGTGHHATTTLVVATQLEIDHKGKKVLDAGCGTGVLAIMAHKLGAEIIEAFDFDEWAYENSLENASVNQAGDIKIYQGTLMTVPLLHESYDIILANINKNVLLDEWDNLVNKLSKNGYLVLSGFYENDVKDFEPLAQKAGLELKRQTVKDDWTCLSYQK